MDGTNPPIHASYQQHSPFLSDLDSFEQTSSPYPDFNSPAGQDPSFSSSVPPTPFTPSYAAAHGSYNNSPRVSDASFIPGSEFNQGSPNPSTATFTNQFSGFDISIYPPDNSFGDDYDPSYYDAPDNNSLLFGSDFINSLDQAQVPHSSSPSLSTSSLGSNNPGVSVSVTPAIESNIGMGSLNAPFDHGSPASSNGDNDHYHDARSRASSVSSSRGPNAITFGFERVNLAQSQSPPPAPPQLYIPTPETSHTSPLPSPSLSHRQLSSDFNPAVNSSPSPGMLSSGGLRMPITKGGLMAPDGPGINVVPATPISAGTGVASTQTAFGQHLMSQGESEPSEDRFNLISPLLLLLLYMTILCLIFVNVPTVLFFSFIHLKYVQQLTPTCSLPPSPLDNSASSLLPSVMNNQQSWPPQSRENSSLSRLPQAPPSPYTFPPAHALTPPPTGGSSSSNGGDNSLQLGAINSSRDASPDSNNGIGNDFLIAISQNPRSRSKSDTSVRPTWPGGEAVQQAQGQTPDRQYSQSPLLPQLSTTHASSFGSPLISQLGTSGSISNLDNSISSNNNNFLSPDYAISSGSASDLRRARSEGYGHRRNALSADMTPIYADPNNSLFSTSTLFGRPSSSTYLSPDPSMAGISTGIGASGAHRRTMSGGSHGHSRSLSRERTSLSASPYPSPHASPRVGGMEPLPDLYSFSGTPIVHVMTQDPQGRPIVASQQPIQVVRQNVTTHATADASQRRRRTEANFICPVPGCGSTFTRHFNLKGKNIVCCVYLGDLNLNDI